MAIMVLEPGVEQRLLAERRRCDGDQYDEVWEGVYIMTPLPDNEHQLIVSWLTTVLGDIVSKAGLGWVFPGVNLSDRDAGWEKNYREPDVAAFLKDGKAINHGTHWQGAADFLVEIISPGERTHDKIPFYGRIGVVELLVIDRDPWTIELYRQKDGGMEKVGQTTLDSPETLECRSVGLNIELLPGQQRPTIKVVHPQSDRQWEF